MDPDVPAMPIHGVEGREHFVDKVVLVLHLVYGSGVPWTSASGCPEDMTMPNMDAFWGCWGSPMNHRFTGLMEMAMSVNPAVHNLVDDKVFYIRKGQRSVLQAGI